MSTLGRLPLDAELRPGSRTHGLLGPLLLLYLPLYIFSGEHWVSTRRRESHQDAAAGAVEEGELKRAGLCMIGACPAIAAATYGPM